MPLAFSPAMQNKLDQIPLAGPLLCFLWALGWLLPNHALPWTAFHSEVWIASGLCLAMLWVLWKIQGGWCLSRSAVFLGVLSALPWWSLLIGQVSLVGMVWMSFVYLLGLVLAFSLGENWAKYDHDHTAISFVLAGASCAAFLSVGIQLYQWLGLTNFDTANDIWVLYYADRGRPDANLGQPNQLATLHLWGLIGVAWALHRKAIGALGVCMSALPILFGIALTQSRTAMLTLSLWLILAFVFGRKRWFPRTWLSGIAALYVAFWIMLALLEPISQALGLKTSALNERLEMGWRLPTWRMFIDAVGERPWLGYGWDQTRLAMLEVFPRHLELTGLPFSQAHNLFLDLILWVGLPLGGLLSIALLGWMLQRFLNVRTREQALIYGALLAVSVHAMLELPLHYAYFLLPTGVLAGALHQMQSPLRPQWQVHKGWIWALTCAAGVLLTLIVRDYLRIEQAHLAWRMEVQNVGTRHDRKPPDTLLLNQWRGAIELSRLTPHTGMSPQEVQRWRDLALYSPSGANLQNMLVILSLNGQDTQAQFWAQRVCALHEKNNCNFIVQRWRELSAPKLPSPVPSQPLAIPPSRRSAQ